MNSRKSSPDNHGQNCPFQQLGEDILTENFIADFPELMVPFTPSWHAQGCILSIQTVPTRFGTKGDLSLWSYSGNPPSSHLCLCLSPEHR